MGKRISSNLESNIKTFQCNVNAKLELLKFYSWASFVANKESTSHLTHANNESKIISEIVVLQANFKL